MLTCNTVWTLVGLFSMFDMTNYDLIVSPA